MDSTDFKFEIRIGEWNFKSPASISSRESQNRIFCLALSAVPPMTATPSKKILLLAASLGAGHLRAAEAIARALRLLDPDCQAEVLDIKPLISPLLRFTQFWGYEFLIEHMPWVWRWFYQSALFQKKRFAAPKFLMTYGNGRIVKYLAAAAPDVIVSTQINCHELAFLLAQKLPQPPRRITVVTDYDAHPIWSKLPADLIVVAHEELADKLVRWGVSRERIEASGIPIDPIFQHSLNRPGLFEKYRLNSEVSTALVMGGSVGFGELDEVVCSLANGGMPMQILAVAGHNEGMRRRLENLKREFESGSTPSSAPPHVSLEVFGFVDFIYELMTLADFFVTKPGGLATSEALSQSLPMIFVNPIAGHEEKNAEFFVKQGAAIAVKRVDQLASAVRLLFEDQRKRLQEMKSAARGLAKPAAASRLAERILRSMP